MQKKEALYESIYKQLLSQIYEGTLPYCSTLPTSRELQSAYGVSDNCIRAALGKLRANGYISTTRGRASKVIVDIISQDAPHGPRSAFSCDKKTLQDFYEVISAIFPSLYTYAAFSCGEQQMQELSKIVRQLPNSDSNDSVSYINLNIRFFKTIFSALENKLIVYIVTTVMQNTLLPAALLQMKSTELKSDFLQSGDELRNVYTAIIEKDYDLTKQCWRVLLSLTEIMAKKAIKNCPDIHEKEHESKAGLQYSNKFKYMLIANDIYQRILSGEYAVGTLLPSIEKAQKFYLVASITVRSAYHMLGELGLIRTDNGLGTTVISLVPMDGSFFDEREDFQKRLDYLETIEFLQIIFGDLLRSGVTLSSTLREKLSGPLNPSHRYSALILCKSIMKGARSPAIYSFYQLISSRLFWGTYRTKIPDGSITVEEKHRICMETVDMLEKGDVERAVVLTEGMLCKLRFSAQEL